MNDTYHKLYESGATIGTLKVGYIGNSSCLEDYQLIVLLRKIIIERKMADKIFAVHSIHYDSDDQLVRELRRVESSHEIIVLPVHIKGGVGHWIVALIDFPNNRTIIIDSMYNVNKSDYVNVFKRCYKIVQAICHFTERSVNLSEHSFQLVNDAPQQPPSSLDCGVFLILYVLFKIDRDISIFSKPSRKMRFDLNVILLNETDAGTFFQPLQLDGELEFSFQSLRRKNKITFKLIHFDDI